MYINIEFKVITKLNIILFNKLQALKMVVKKIGLHELK